MMTWLRRLGVVALATFVSVTTTCIAINVVTRPPERIAPGFGRYVPVGASKVHYQRWGERGTPIVLVPGVLESSVAWSKVGPLLGRSHRVYALDLPGHGYTRYHGPMTLRGQADLVDGFIRALDLQGATVVGHSMGAAVVGSVALHDPHAIGRVVFADGDGLPIGIGPRWTRRLILATRT